MRSILLLVAMSLSVSVFGQEIKKHIKPFKSVVVSRGIEATLIKSDDEDLIITSNGVDPGHIIVENKGDELRIKIATKALWQEMEANHWWVKVQIPYTSLISVEVLTGARITTREAIEAESIDLAVSMGGELEIEVLAKEIFFDANMGGFAEIAGKVKNLKATASMGSDVDMRGLDADYVKAKSSMGSELMLTALKEFDGHATMGGYIKVEGNPERFYENTGMGGDISGGGVF